MQLPGTWRCAGAGISCPYQTERQRSCLHHAHTDVVPGTDRFKRGDEVIGFTNDRGSHAELVAVDEEDLTPRPPGVPTLVDFDAAARYGAKTDGNAEGASAEVLAGLAQLIADGKLEIPIARVYPLEQVRDALREREQHHTLGKIVLHP